jgi:hypothetical protein
MRMIRVSRNWGLWSLAMVLAAGLSLSACGKKEESAEKPPESSMSDQMKNATQKAGEAMKETGEKAGEAMKNAGEKAGEATEKAGEKAGDAMKDESKPEGAPSE